MRDSGPKQLRSMSRKRIILDPSTLVRELLPIRVMKQTTYRNCTFCEAICGVVVETDGDRVLSVRGDDQDPLSRGYICPKAHALKEVHADADRLRRPLRRTAAGWQEVSWDDALTEAGERLVEIRDR